MAKTILFLSLTLTIVNTFNGCSLSAPSTCSTWATCASTGGACLFDSNAQNCVCSSHLNLNVLLLSQCPACLTGLIDYTIELTDNNGDGW